MSGFINRFFGPKINQNNDYGITQKEWKQIKKDLKKADKTDNSFSLKKSDYKEIKENINVNNLGSYMQNKGVEMQRALGLSLKGKVDGTEDIKQAQEIVNNYNLGLNTNNKPVDKIKVMQYIVNANREQIAQNFNEGMNNILEQGTAAHAQSLMPEIEKELGKAFSIT